MLKSCYGWVYLYFLGGVNVLRIHHAIDSLSANGTLEKRTLVFIDPDDSEKTIEVDIPDNYGSVLFKGVVYDWWGRKSSPDDSIKKIIMPWPNQVQATSGIWYHDRLNDQYIVEQTNGKYAIATLHFPNGRDVTHPYDTRQSVTNGLLKRRPCLRISFTVYEGDTETIEKIEQYKNHPNQPPL